MDFLLKFLEFLKPDNELDRKLQKLSRKLDRIEQELTNDKCNNKDKKCKKCKKR